MSIETGKSAEGMLRRPLLSVATGLLTAACLGVLAYLMYRERDVLVAHVLNADKRQLAMVATWYTVGLAVYVSAWASMMARLGGGTDFRRHVGIFCLANAAKRLPGTLWYVGGRAVLYARAGTSPRTTIVASIIEGTLTCLAAVAIAVPFLAVALPHGRWLSIGAGATVLALLLNPKSIRWLLKRAAKGGEPIGVGLRDVYAWLGLYVVAWAIGGLLLASVVQLFQPLTANQLPWVVGSFAAAGGASMLVVFLPSNFGITEVTLAALLGQIMPAGTAVLVAVSARVLATLLDIVAGGVGLLLQRLDSQR